MSKRYTFRPEPPNQDDRHTQWAADLQRKLADAGYIMSVRTCLLAWEAYSETLCAGWIYHEDKTADEIIFFMRPWLDEIK